MMLSFEAFFRFSYFLKTKKLTSGASLIILIQFLFLYFLFRSGGRLETLFIWFCPLRRQGAWIRGEKVFIVVLYLT